MSQEERRIKQIKSGEDAKALLENPTLAAAFASLDQLNQARIMRATNPEEAYQAAVCLQSTDTVRKALTVAVLNGQSAADAVFKEAEVQREKAAYESQVRDELAQARKARAEYEESKRGEHV